MEEQLSRLRDEHARELKTLGQTMQSRLAQEAADRPDDRQVLGMSPNSVTNRLALTDQLKLKLEETTSSLIRLVQGTKRCSLLT